MTTEIRRATAAWKSTRIVISLAMLGGALAMTALQSKAQSSTYQWTTPANVSSSGAASRPSIAISNDGVIHATWWDSIDGQKYAHTNSLTNTNWSASSGIGGVYGDRRVDGLTGAIQLFPPIDVRLFATKQNSVYLFWFGADQQLNAIRGENNTWGAPTLIARAAIDIEGYTDISGTLHIAYARSLNLTDSPAGLYYRTSGSTGWNNQILVYASPYFRSQGAESLSLSITGDTNGHLLIAWQDQLLGQSYARSQDAGATWTAPQPLTTTINSRITQPAVGLSPSGEFIMVWRNLSVPGCGFTQRASADGGETWRTPELILGELTTCPTEYSLRTGGDGRLWLIGLPRAVDRSTLKPGESTSLPTNPGFAAAWDGKSWSSPINLDLAINKDAAGQSEELTCLQYALGSAFAALLGCTGGADMYVSQNAVPLVDLVPPQKRVWTLLQRLSSEVTNAANPEAIAPDGTLAMVTDDQDGIHVMWSATDGDAAPGTALYAISSNAGKWTEGNIVLRSSATSASSIEGNASQEMAQQPSLAADQKGKVHVVYSGKQNGKIQYSWALLRDVNNPSGWNEPIALPSPTEFGSYPAIVSDPRGDTLYVLYGVPYNEKRGVWFTRSNDGGATWSAAHSVADAQASNWNSVSKTRLALDAESNVLHATWLRSVIPGNAGSQAAYYAQSSDGGQTWSASLLLAEGVIDWPEVTVAAKNQVHISWLGERRLAQVNSPAPYELWNQLSSDAGISWNSPAVVKGFDTISGKPGFAADGRGRVFLSAVGEGDQRDAVLLYAIWNGDGWGAYERLILGQPAMRGNSASTGVLGSSGRFQVALRLWGYTVQGSNAFMVQTIGRTIDAVAEVQALATYTPEPSVTPLPTNTPPATLTPTPVLNPSAPPSIDRGSISALIPPVVGVAIASIVMLVGLGIFFTVSRRSK